MMAAAAISDRDHADDVRFMALALELGRRGLGRTWPNPAVGAVAVALGGQLVGRGWTQAGGRPHAETEALRRAGAAARGATLYVSLEPCCHHGKTPPCTDAIIAAGIVRVVAPLEDPNPKVAGHGFARLRAGGIAVDVGVGAAEARRAHAGHLCRMRDGRPHVTLKLAVSADAKAGLAGRRPAAITGEIARERVQLMRAMNDAVLTGIGSVHADDPNLNCRLNGMIGRSPVRVVLDSGLTLPLGSRLAATARQIPVWVMAAAGAREAAEEALRGRGVEVFRTKPGEGGLDLTAVVRLLAERGITRLMVEAGPRVAASFVKADLVDAAVLFRGPDTIGADGIDALEGLKLEALTQSPRLKSLGVEGLGRDTVEIFERAIFERA